MSKIYNFFLDIDGTMLGRGQQVLSDALTASLRYAQSKGSKIFVNTGRTKAFVPKSIKELDCIDGLLCGCGAYIEYHGKTISEHFLTLEQITRVANEFIRLELDKDLLLEGKDYNYYLGEGSERHKLQGFIQFKSTEDIKSLGFVPKIHKFTVHTRLEKRAEFFDSISDEFYTMQFPHYCEIVPKGFDKGRAMQITEDLLCLDPSLSVAVGDSMNDEGMLRYAATSVAMGNATDEVKAMCDIITDTVDNDGVAKLIYDLMG